MTQTQKGCRTDKIFTGPFTLMTLVNLFICLGWQGLLTGLPLLATAHGADTVYVGTLTAVAAISALVVRPVSGVAVDVIGRRPVLLVSTAAMLALTFGSLMFPTGIAGLVIRALQGFAWGFASTANTTLPLDVISPKRFAESMALFGVFSSAAMALAPTITSQLSDQGLDDWIVYSSVAFMGVTIVLTMTLPLSGYHEPGEKNGVSLKGAFKPNRLVFPPAVFPSILICLVSMAMGSLQTFLNLSCADQGLTATYLYYIAYGASTLVARPLVGRLADKRGFFLIGVLACLVSAAAMALVAITKSDAMLIISGVAVGTGVGAAAAVLQAMAVARADKSSKGAATSTYMLFMNLGVSTGSLIGGALIPLIGYSGMYLTMGGVLGLACLLLVAAGRKRVAIYSEASKR